jgi:hypothetical protein
LEFIEGSTPSSRSGLSVLALTLDFVQSPTRFFAAVEAEEAFVAVGFFPFPIVIGELRLELGRSSNGAIWGEKGERREEEDRRCNKEWVKNLPKQVILIFIAPVRHSRPHDQWWRRRVA